MSFIHLCDAKSFLYVIHSDDDIKLQLLLDGAEDESLKFMNREQFGSLTPADADFATEVENIPPSVRAGVYMLLQASYQSDPEDQQTLREVAETRLMPYRCSMGI